MLFSSCSPKEQVAPAGVRAGDELKVDKLIQPFNNESVREDIQSPEGESVRHSRSPGKSSPKIARPCASWPVTMDEPRWVDEADVLSSRRALAEFGGMIGVRDAGLLTSALNRPKFVWGLFKHPRPDLARLAASYTHGLARIIHSLMATNALRSSFATHFYA